MRKEKIQGVLCYNPSQKRYGLMVNESWEIEGFHCGDHLEIRRNGRWVSTRIEMGTDMQWYLAGTDYYGDLEELPARCDI